MVYDLAFRILGDPDLAATATEYTFLRAFRGLPKCRETSPRLWLVRMAVTVCQEQLSHIPILGSDTCEPSVGDDAHEAVTAQVCAP